VEGVVSGPGSRERRTQIAVTDRTSGVIQLSGSHPHERTWTPPHTAELMQPIAAQGLATRGMGRSG